MPASEVDPLESNLGRTIETLEEDIHAAENELKAMQQDVEDMRKEYQELVAEGMAEEKDRQSCAELEAIVFEYIAIIGNLREHHESVRRMRKEYLDSKVSERD